MQRHLQYRARINSVKDIQAINNRDGSTTYEAIVSTYKKYWNGRVYIEMKGNCRVIVKEIDTNIFEYNYKGGLNNGILATIKFNSDCEIIESTSTDTIVDPNEHLEKVSVRYY